MVLKNIQSKKIENGSLKNLIKRDRELIFEKLILKQFSQKRNENLI